MSDQLLDVLKLALLALLYLFFARVLWAVWSEVRTPTAPRAAGPRRPATASPSPAPGGPQPAAPPKRRRGEVTRLTVLEPKSRKGQLVAISAELTIGRAAGCTLPLVDDTFASQVHARVFVSEGRVWVEDLGSTNGTYLNGTRVGPPAPLRPGDRLQVGGTVLEAG
jgi:pSer/pThr/pTyr-binding forkhead associated (FHA) protein